VSRCRRRGLSAIGCGRCLSELDHAALILPDTDLPLLSRELVYTAVTRVRRSITIVGRRALLEQAIARPLERSSGLADRLRTDP